MRSNILRVSVLVLLSIILLISGCSKTLIPPVPTSSPPNQTEELKDIEEHITKAKSNLDKADSDFMRQREKELTNNEKIIGAKKNRKILLILGIVGMLVSSIFFFYEDLTFLGFILFSLSLWDILSYKKSEERFIQKFGTKEFFELKEKKEKAVQSFKRLEQISRAKEELQTLTFNEK